MSRLRKIYVYAQKLVLKNPTLFIKKPKDLLVPCIDSLMMKPQNERNIVLDAQTGEYAQLIEVKKVGKLYLLGFSKLNMADGPARGTLQGVVDAFPLSEDEGFANMSSVLYDPKKEAFITESSKCALSAAAMLDFLLQFAEQHDGVSVDILSVVDADVFAKLDSGGKILRRIELGICPLNIADASLENFKAFDAFIMDENRNRMDGVVYVTLQSGRSLPLTQRIGRMFDNVCEVIKSTPAGSSPVTKCKVKVQNGEDGESEILDLLNARLQQVFSILVGNQRIIRYTKRYECLREAYRVWGTPYFN